MFDCLVFGPLLPAEPECPSACLGGITYAISIPCYFQTNVGCRCHDILTAIYICGIFVVVWLFW